MVKNTTPKNGPCQACGHIPEMVFGTLATCIHQDTAPDNDDTRATPTRFPVAIDLPEGRLLLTYNPLTRRHSLNLTLNPEDAHSAPQAPHTPTTAPRSANAPALGPAAPCLAEA